MLGHEFNSLEIMKSRKSGVVMHAYNPRGREVEKAESLGAWPVCLFCLTNSMPVRETSPDKKVCGS